MPGPCMLVGCPGSGKSKKALEMALEAVDRTGFPMIIIDPARAWNFTKYHHAATVRELVDRVWRDGQHTAYTPEDPAEIVLILKAARKGRQVIIVLDEFKDLIPSPRSIPHVLQAIFRLWRHLEIAEILAATQCYTDAARPFKGSVSKWKIFRLPPGPDQDDCCRDFKLDPARVGTLAEEEAIDIVTGFQK